MTAEPAPLLSCSKLRVTVPGRVLVDKLELTLGNGELVAVLGPNGTGKSLTLLTLAGLRPPERGRVMLRDADLFAARRRTIAQQLALLPQFVDDIFPATVLDTALVGRHPHIGPFVRESQQDVQTATAALATMGLTELAARDVLTLSGGERRRLAIAQVLTQAPDVYLLDEPTNHLDPQHQLDALHVFRRLANRGAGVIACLHDVNLAVRFADRCLLLFGDGRWQLGRTDDVLTAARLSELFATPMEAIAWRNHRLFVANSDHAALQA